jgi:hypothetical protein
MAARQAIFLWSDEYEMSWYAGDAGFAGGIQKKDPHLPVTIF